MDLKQLVTRFAYKIEPDPEGGFIARASDPSVPAIKAPTREELRQKIQQNIRAALLAEFPGLNVPAEGKHLEMSFHVEHQPGGGFSIHSSDPNAPVIQTTDQNDFESRFLEKFLSFAGKHLMPELSQALAAQVGSANVKVVVNRKTSFRMNSGPRGIASDASKAFAPQALESSDARQFSSPDDNPGIVGGTISGKPITPESSDAGKVFGLILLAGIIAALTYFFVYYR